MIKLDIKQKRNYNRIYIIILLNFYFCLLYGDPPTPLEKGIFYSLDIFPDSSAHYLNIDTINLTGSEKATRFLYLNHSLLWKMDLNLVANNLEVLKSSNRYAYDQYEHDRLLLLEALLLTHNREFKEGYIFLDKYLVDFKNKHKRDHPDVLLWKPYLAFLSHFSQKGFEIAHKLYQESIDDLTKEYPEGVNMAKIMECLLSILYHYQGDQESAMMEMTHAIASCKNREGCKDKMLSILYNWQTDFLLNDGDIEGGFKSGNLAYKFATNAYQRGKAAGELGEAYGYLKDTLNLIRYSEESRRLMKEVFGINQDYIGVSGEYAEVLYEIGEYDRLIELNEELEEYVVNQKSHSSYGSNSNIPYLLYEYHLQICDFEKASNYLNTNIVRTYQNIEYLDSWDAPNTYVFPTHYWDVRVLGEKARLAYYTYLDNEEENYSKLEIALNCAYKTDTLLSNLLSTSINTESKIKNLKKYYSLYELFIDIAFSQYSMDGSKTSLEHLLYFIDKSSDLDLFFSIEREEYALRNASVKRDFEKRDSLKKLLVSKSQNEKPGKIEKELRLTESRIRDALSEGEYWLNLRKVKIENILLELKGKTLIDYHYNEDWLIIIEVSNEGSFAQKILLSQKLENLIFEFKNNLTDAFVNCSTCEKKSASAFNTNLSSIQKLLKSPLRIEHSDVIIIPDKHLWHLPFDIVLHDEGLPPSKAIVINHSLGHMTELGKKDKPVLNGVSVLLPKFPSSEQSYKTIGEFRGKYLSPLKFADREAENISKVISDVKIYQSQDANRNTLERVLQGNSIVHLISHAKQNMDDPMQSFLALNHPNSGGIEIDKLYFDEFFLYTVESPLVVLSACETGIGKLSRGVGMSSFSKTLMANGAHSVVSSLWQVNDRSTSMIISSFYQYLAEGYQKDRALLEAKKDYFSQVDEEFRNPYYWSGIVLTGKVEGFNYSKMDPNKCIYFFLIPLLLVLAMLGWRYYWYG